jgi:hypothetical protein
MLDPDILHSPSPIYNPTIAKDLKRVATNGFLSDLLLLQLLQPFHPILSSKLDVDVSDRIIISIDGPSRHLLERFDT